MFVGKDDSVDEEHQKLVAPPDFDGPTGTRYCTDILCSMLIVAMWIAMTAVGMQALATGDYRLLLQPMDYDGNICGTDFNNGRDGTTHDNRTNTSEFNSNVIVGTPVFNITNATNALLNGTNVNLPKATNSPTNAPTNAPTDAPTDAPIIAPINAPTNAPINPNITNATNANATNVPLNGTYITGTIAPGGRALEDAAATVEETLDTLNTLNNLNNNLKNLNNLNLSVLPNSNAVNVRKDMTDYPKLLFINSYGGGVCVKECPKLANATRNGLTDVRTLVTYGGIYQLDGAELPKDFVQMADYSNSTDALFCTDDTCYPDNSTIASWNSIGIGKGFGYAYYAADTYDVLSYCLLTADAQLAIQEAVGSKYQAFDFTRASYEFTTKISSDLWVSRNYILAFGLGVSFLISLTYIFLLRIPLLLNAVIWLSMILVIAIFAGMGYFTMLKATEFEISHEEFVFETSLVSTSVNNQDTVKTMRITAYLLYAVSVLLFMVMVCLRKQIQLAIGCVKEAGRAVHSMPFMFIIPILQVVGFAIFFAVWVVYAVFLASTGHINVVEFPIDIDTGAEIAIRLYEMNDSSYYSSWFLLFCLYWTANFIIAVGHVALSMCVARWYFCKNKKIMLGCGTMNVIKSINVTLFFHLGTCAYGALLVATVEFIRSVLAKIQQKAKQHDMYLAQLLLCCCQCCLWFFEQCLKFINKNAYIQCAIFGTAFCKSARQAFFLVARNIARISSIAYVSGAVLIIGKLFISVATTAIAYTYIIEDIEDALPTNYPHLEDEPPMHLHYISGPIVVIFFLAYMISDMFMSVFDMAIYTVLHCFVADEEMFDAPRYAEGSLKKFIDKHSD